MEMSVYGSASSQWPKGGSSRRLALESAPRAARHGIDERTRSPRRLLELATRAAHTFHAVRWIGPQPAHGFQPPSFTFGASGEALCRFTGTTWPVMGRYSSWSPRSSM